MGGGWGSTGGTACTGSISALDTAHSASIRSISGFGTAILSVLPGSPGFDIAYTVRTRSILAGTTLTPRVLAVQNTLKIFLIYSEHDDDVFTVLITRFPEI